MNALSLFERLHLDSQHVGETPRDELIALAICFCALVLVPFCLGVALGLAW